MSISAPNIFQDYTQRFFFFYGLLEDEFYTPSLKPSKFEEILHQYLQLQGYQRILFFNQRQKLYFLDERSHQLIRPSNSPVADTTTAPKKSSKINAGPLGQKRLLDAPKPAIQPLSTQQSALTGLNDLELVNNFSVWLKDDKIKTAFIFTDALGFIQHIDSNALPQMISVFQECASLFTHNHNICIFFLPAKNIGFIRDQVLDRHPEWYFLRDRMFTPKNLPTQVMIPIATPREDEVYYACQSQRLRRNLPVDWQIFSQSIVQINRYMRSERQTLKQLNLNLQSVKALDAAAFRQLNNQTEQLPALERLQQMRGIDKVRNEIEKIVNSFQDDLKDKTIYDNTTIIRFSTVARLLPPPPSRAKGLNLSLILQGNPGTGKTTIAKLIGEIYRDAGILPSGHTVKASREDLVAGYVGQTAIQTSQKIADAMGGVLFIDEAYRLTEGGENDFGKEAIETILEAMTNHQGEFAVIAAGYPAKIEAFLNANEGLKRRFGRILTIEDYDPATLQTIFEEQVARKKQFISADLASKLPDFFKNLHGERDEKSFGNAGEIIDLYQKIDEARKARVRGKSFSSPELSLTIEVADIPEKYLTFLQKRSANNIDTILAELDSLIGLKQVKQTVKNMANRLTLNQIRRAENNLATGHYLFLGNPGTGKTTVARLMGRIFKQLGLLKKGNLIEATRVDLVAGYSGQSAIKTQEILEKSLDNVLFIDEAYQLLHGETDSFGKEALETLIAFMETHRDRLCIIAAGYPENMMNFVNSNPGLPSRFSNQIVFENYKADEMLAIFKQMATAEKLVLDTGVETNLMIIFEQWEKNPTPTFANGREVRNLLAQIQTQMDNRLCKLSPPLTAGDERAFLITVEDLAIV